MEKFPFAKPRIISDNGPQFIAKDFKEFIRIHSHPIIFKKKSSGLGDFALPQGGDEK